MKNKNDKENQFIDKTIAKLKTSPQKVSLSGVPNYIEFESKKSGGSPIYFDLKIVSNSITHDDNKNTKLLLTIQETKTKEEYQFYGTNDAKYVSNNTFYVGTNNSISVITENLKACLMKNKFFSSNFELKVAIESDTINIKSLGVGENYDFVVVYFDEKKFDKEIGVIPSISIVQIEMEIKNVKQVEAQTPFALFGINDTSENMTRYSCLATNLQMSTGSSDFYFPENTYFASHADALAKHLNQHEALSKTFEVSISKGSPLKLVLQFKNIENINAEVYSVNSKFLGEPVKKIKYSNAFTSTNRDTIDSGSNTQNIELDVYTDTELPLGKDFLSVGDNNHGSYLTTIQKAYFKQPLWFNLNSTFGNSTGYSNEFLNATDWCGSGTCRDFRFVAYRNDGVNKSPFYKSDVFYVLKGYGRNLEDNDLKDYIFDFEEKNKVLPLTHQPTLTHVKEQKQFFNFIAANTGSSDYSLFVTYELRTQSNQLIERIQKHELTYANCETVNTLPLDIDGAIEESGKENVGIVKVYLSTADGTEASHPQTYRILPESLHSVKNFAFLNALGGWSSYGFTDNVGVDFKASANTIFKTQTPDYNISSEIESVHNKETEEIFTVQSMPIHPEVSEWLKEMSASEVVYELDTDRYIIVTDMRIKHSAHDDLVRVEMKYKYSDTYNGRI